MQNYWSRELGRLKNASLSSGTYLMYGDVYVEGNIMNPKSSCTSWMTLFSELSVMSVTRTLKSVKLVTLSGGSDGIHPKNITCSNKSRVLTVQQNLISAMAASGSSVLADVNCSSSPSRSNHSWTTAVLSSFPAFCLDCPSTTNQSLIMSSVNTLSPCLPHSFPRSVNFARVLVLTFEDLLPAPNITMMSVAASQSSLFVGINLSADGIVYCAASAAAPTSSQQILLSGNIGLAKNGFTSMTIAALTPSTLYGIYCLTKSSDGIYSTLANAITSRTAVRTSCCKKIYLDLRISSVFVGRSKTNAVALSLSSLPSSNITISLSAAYFFPANVTISFTSSLGTSLAAFVGSLDSRSITVTASLFGPSASEFEVNYYRGSSIAVLADGLPPAVPSVASAQFSNDGTLVTLTFDSSTNRGGSTAASFTCTSLLQFSGSSKASCQWSADSTQATISFRSVNPLNIGDNITVLGGVIRAACASGFSASSCLSWTAISKVNASVVAPANAASPVVAFSLPATIGSCDSLAMDLSSSTGNGGRSWKSVSFTVTSSATNVSAIESYLNNQYVFMPPTVLSTGTLQTGKLYTFTVQLCNFLGGCATGSTSVAVLQVTVPFIALVGSQSLTMVRGSTLSLSTSAYIAQCDGSKTSNTLQYSWIATNANGVTLSSIVSYSKDTSKFLLASYSLQKLTSYAISVTATDSVGKRKSSASVTVYVEASYIQAVISGGTLQSLRALSSFQVNATKSYDNDQASFGNAGLQYKWVCSTVSPIFSASCLLDLTTSTMTRTVLKGVASSSSVNSTSSLEVIVFDSSRSSAAAILLTVLPANAPAVGITSVLTTAVNTNSIFVLEGTLSASAAVRYEWTVDEASLNLTSASLSATNAVLSASVVSATVYESYLVLSAGSLPIRSTLTFSLTAYLSSDSSLVSATSIIVVTNGPPLPGTVGVDPLAGVQLSTMFLFTANAWTDADLPVTYEFRYLDPASNSSLVIQSRSQSTYGSSLLPAGLQRLNYSVTCLVYIYDVVDAVADEYVTLSVAHSSVNDSHINLLLSSQLLAAGSNVNGVKQTISTIGSIVNSVNCSSAPNCTQLNRHECSSTLHTCGACFTSADFIGAAGDSNEACILLSEIVTTASSGDASCTSSNDCNAWSYCNLALGMCQYRNKSCINNCMGNGTTSGYCQYQLVARPSTIVTTCAVNDPSCKAVCVCASGLHGDDCSLSAQTVATKKSIRSQLIDGLALLIETENIALETTEYWAKSIATFTASTSELSATSSSTARNVSSSILSAASEASFALSSISALTSALDALFDYSFGQSSSGRRLLAGGTQLKSLVDQMGTLASNGMRPGQQSASLVTTNYRLQSSYLASTTSSGSHSFTLPPSEMELLYGTSQSLADLPLEDFASNKVNLVGVSNEFAGASGSFLSGTFNYTAGVLRLQSSASATACSKKSSLLVNFTFVHTQDEVFDLTNYTNTTVSAHCRLYEKKNYTMSCPHGKTVTLRCDGSNNFMVSAVCPMQRTIPRCVPTSYPDLEDACELLSYSAKYTKCQCDLCVVESRRRQLVADPFGRHLQSSEANVAEFGSISKYAFDELGSVMMTADTLNAGAVFKETYTVILTFAIIYISVLLLLLAKPTYEYVDQKIWRSKKSHKSVMPLSSMISSGKEAHSLGHSVTDPNKLAQEEMLSYVRQFFSTAFSESSLAIRLTKEIIYKHKYIASFAVLEGMEKWIGGLEIVTIVSTQLFMLAVFYDTQFPSNNGECATLTDEMACLSKRSVFSDTESMCYWGADSITGKYQCFWQRPQFGMITICVISVIVFAISGPTSYALQFIFECILLAPTIDDVRDNIETLHFRRRSAVVLMEMNDEARSTTIVHPKRISDQVQPQLPKPPARGTRNPSILGKGQALSSHYFMNDEVKNYVEHAHRLTNPLLRKGMVASAVVDDLKQVQKYKDYSSFVSDLRTCYDTMKSTYDPQLAALYQQWHQLIAPSEIQSHDLHECIRDELDAVTEEASAIIKALKSQPTAHVGVKLLELFVKDWLGRHTRQAVIFSKKVNPLKDLIVLTWWMKCMTFAGICLLNIYFVFACVLYAANKGVHWQRGWLNASIISLVVDVLFNQVTIAITLYYFVPDLIADRVRTVRDIILGSVKAMFVAPLKQKSRRNDAKSEQAVHQDAVVHSKAARIFCPSRYLFVSAHVARAFPDLVESNIVLSYQSYAVSRDQSLRWLEPWRFPRKRKADADADGSEQSTWFERLLEWLGWYRRRPLTAAGNSRGFLAMFGLTITSVLLMFGSQNRFLQETIISSINPLCIGALAFIGVAFMRITPALLIVGFFLIVIGLVGAFYLVKYSLAAYKRSEDVVAISDVIDSELKDVLTARILPVNGSGVRDEDNESGSDSGSDDDDSSLDESLYQVDNNEVDAQVGRSSLADIVRKLPANSPVAVTEPNVRGRSTDSVRIELDSRGTESHTRPTSSYSAHRPASSKSTAGQRPTASYSHSRPSECAPESPHSGLRPIASYSSTRPRTLVRNADTSDSDSMTVTSHRQQTIPGPAPVPSTSLAGSVPTAPPLVSSVRGHVTAVSVSTSSVASVAIPTAPPPAYEGRRDHFKTFAGSQFAVGADVDIDITEPVDHMAERDADGSDLDNLTVNSDDAAGHTSDRGYYRQFTDDEDDGNSCHDADIEDGDEVPISIEDCEYHNVGEEVKAVHGRSVRFERSSNSGSVISGYEGSDGSSAGSRMHEDHEEHYTHSRTRGHGHSDDEDSSESDEE
jgi:hypothetical protein